MFPGVPLEPAATLNVFPSTGRGKPRSTAIRKRRRLVKIKSFVLGGAALLSVVGLSAPALSHTHHPSTKAERKQTDDLNAQQLAQAQGQPMHQQAANTATPAANTAMPEQQNNATTTTSQPNTAPAEQ